uniref:Uncharacterized protein n=1 Tax=Parascaris univalens TaxID=6257 RepID=A0A915BAC0_PARUN
MASAPKDDLLDLIFSAPINLPEVKGANAAKTSVSVADAQHSDDNYSNEEDKSVYKDTEIVTRNEEYITNIESDRLSHNKVEGVFETSSAHFSTNEVDEQHYMIRGSVVESTDFHDDINKSSEHSDAEEIPQKDEQVVAPMRINADINVTYGRSHKEEYIEEDVHINDARNGYEVEMLKEEEREEAEEIQPEYEEKADAFLDYDREQMRKGPESIEEPSFKVDTDASEIDDVPDDRDEEYLQTEAEGYAAVAPKSHTSTNASVNRMHYVESPAEEQQQDQQFYGDNVFMRKREEYPDVGKDVSERISRRSSRSSYTAISVKRDSTASTQHGTFEPNPAFSIADEVSSAPGVRSLKSIFEKADIPDDDKHQRGAHPPVIDYMNEEDYRHQYEPKEEQVGGTAAIEPVQRVEAPVRRMDASANKEIKQIRENEMVDEAEQKPVSELLSIFGGRRTAQNVIILQKSTEKEQKSKAVAAPPVRSDAPMALTTSAEAITRPGKLVQPPQSQRSLTTQSSPMSPPQRVYLPPRPLTVKASNSSSVRAVANVRQFVKLWGQAPYTPGDPHPFSPIPAEMSIAHERHVIKMGEQEGRKHSVKLIETGPTNISNEKINIVVKNDHHAEESKVDEAPNDKQIEVRSNTPDVIYSQNYAVEEVMIDDVPVSQRRKIFEQNESAWKAPIARRRSSKALKSKPKVEQEVAHVTYEREVPILQESVVAEVEQLLHENAEHIPRNEIEVAVEEIANSITHLTPVAERRKYFENNAESSKREFAIPSRAN